MQIGSKIQAQRERLGWTQQELADKLFVTRQTVSKWERDQSTPDLEALVGLCALLHLDVKQLLQPRVPLTAQVPSTGMNQLLGAPVLRDIAGNAANQPLYVRARFGEAAYPQDSPTRLAKLTAKWRFAVGEADFGAQVTLKDEQGHALMTLAPEDWHVTIGLVQSVRFGGVMLSVTPVQRYIVLLSFQQAERRYRLLIDDPKAVPACIAWLDAHARPYSDALHLREHVAQFDWQALSAGEFERLAANTPYMLPYQLGGASWRLW